ncbi:SusC/RagA family TonB-linked outer membrane protein [Pedobacter aquatilis]|uniref:SusC/RagA family TonB-linked outer membrane protein n=1 Tax=Pedobacter aquatilis TaxID=351343 RepID=UPI00293115EE|nr:SusC/RagA family TonB-linked outer membrane protein [Pedobacter aquatilis]
MKKLLQSLFVMMLVAFSAMAQQRTITGTVTESETGKTIPGASVSFPGTKIVTQTNTNGSFSVQVPANATTVTFTYIGFVTKTVSLNGRTNISVALASDALALTDVVVTGYTKTSRANSVSATSTVKAVEINNIPQASMDQLLQGRVPGLTVAAGSGQPGAAARVTLRGPGSVNGGTTPLYILDGVAIETSVFQSLNPNDIETITTLKDASATSLYGSRGGNGVIVMTSKKGKQGKTSFTYNGQYGVTLRTQPNFDMLTTAQLLSVQEAGKSGAGWTLSPLNTATNTSLGVATKAKLLDSISRINTNWADIYFKNGAFQNHQVAASGGNEKTQFYTSLNYYSEDGITERSNLNRYNFRANLDHKDGKFSFSTQAAAGWAKSNFIESEAGVALANPFAAAYLALPWENPYSSNGTILTSGNFNSSGQTLFDSRIGSNALDRYNSTSNLQNQLKTNLTVNAAYDIIDGLKVKTLAGVDFRETNTERSIYPGTYPGGLVTQGASGSYAVSNLRNLILTSTSGFTYFKTLGEKHVIDAQALFEVVNERYSSFGYTGYGINPKLLNTPAGITAGTATNGMIPSVSGGKTQSAYASLIGIARYTYDDKYTFQGSVRRDGSSKLPSENRFHYFYALGANWNAKKENFLKNVNAIDALTLRASYGTTATGNGLTSDFGYIASYSNVSYAGSTGIAPSTPGNPVYTWEYKEKSNVGFDISLLKRRIELQVDLYNEITQNSFITQSLSRTSGFSSLSINAGKVRNRGIEANAAFTLYNDKDWNIVFNANASYNKNLVTDLGQVKEFEGGTSIIRVGLPLGSHYSVKYAGADPQTGAPLYYNRDGSTTTTYNAATQSVAEFGTYFAPYQGGFGPSIRFKGFDVTAFFTFMKGFSRFNNESYFITNTQTISSYNQTTDILNYWTTPGQITQIPKLGSTRNFSSYDIRDASFLRFRNASLGYSFSPEVLKKIKLGGLRIYAQGQNLYTWTKWQGFDPEDSNNLASFEYPASRKFTFGIDVKF